MRLKIYLFILITLLSSTFVNASDANEEATYLNPS